MRVRNAVKSSSGVPSGTRSGTRFLRSDVQSTNGIIKSDLVSSLHFLDSDLINFFLNSEIFLALHNRFVNVLLSNWDDVRSDLRFELLQMFRNIKAAMKI